jgi:hypothetical protein
MHPNKSLGAETKNVFKRDNSVKIFIIPRPNLNLTYVNSVMCPYIKFELNVCNPYKDNEQKLKISFSPKFKRDNSVKNSKPSANSNLTCAFL